MVVNLYLYGKFITTPRDVIEPDPGNGDENLANVSHPGIALPESNRIRHVLFYQKLVVSSIVYLCCEQVEVLR
ncbi:MAG: hypothetical protein ACTS77_00790 [Arsenophonus sp. NC-TX2-MAG3]